MTKKSKEVTATSNSKQVGRPKKNSVPRTVRMKIVKLFEKGVKFSDIKTIVQKKVHNLTYYDVRAIAKAS